MRNFLDRASIAQSLDGERLMGSLRFPDQRIVSDQFGCKEAGYTNETRLLTGPIFLRRRICCVKLLICWEFLSRIAT
jgi:hypothetical protein